MAIIKTIRKIRKRSVLSILRVNKNVQSEIIYTGNSRYTLSTMNGQSQSIEGSKWKFYLNFLKKISNSTLNFNLLKNIGLGNLLKDFLYDMDQSLFNNMCSWCIRGLNNGIQKDLVEVNQIPCFFCDDHINGICFKLKWNNIEHVCTKCAFQYGTVWNFITEIIQRAKNYDFNQVFDDSNSYCSQYRNAYTEIIGKPLYKLYFQQINLNL